MKEAGLERLHPVGSNYATFWKRQIYALSKEMSGCQGSSEGGMNSQSTGDFEGSETALYDNTMVAHMSCYLCPNSWNVHARSYSNAHGGLWIIDYNKCTTLVRGVDGQGGSVWGAARGCGVCRQCMENLSSFLPNFL